MTLKDHMGVAAVISHHFQNGETICCNFHNTLQDDSNISAAEATVFILSLNY